jgi:hypothetical protein
MPLPFDDWQFYVVSAVVLAGVWMAVRPFLPRRWPCARSCPGAGSRT